MVPSLQFRTRVEEATPAGDSITFNIRSPGRQKKRGNNIGETC